MQRRQARGGAVAYQRIVQGVDVEVDHVEVRCLREHLVQHDRVPDQPVRLPRVAPETALDDRNEVGRGSESRRLRTGSRHAPLPPASRSGTTPRVPSRRRPWAERSRIEGRLGRSSSGGFGWGAYLSEDSTTCKGPRQFRFPMAEGCARAATIGAQNSCDQHDRFSPWLSNGAMRSHFAPCLAPGDQVGGGEISARRQAFRLRRPWRTERRETKN